MAPFQLSLPLPSSGSLESSEPFLCSSHDPNQSACSSVPATQSLGGPSPNIASSVSIFASATSSADVKLSSPVASASDFLFSKVIFSAKILPWRNAMACLNVQLP